MTTTLGVNPRAECVVVINHYIENMPMMMMMMMLTMMNAAVTCVRYYKRQSFVCFRGNVYERIIDKAYRSNGGV